MERYATVIGGINVDVKGYPENELIPGTSNPGRVYTSPGGVGRNIAHNLALLGIPVYLLSAIGDDGFGREALSGTKQAGVRVEQVRILKEHCTGTYLSILDQTHDLAVAISDMTVIRRIDTSYLAEHREIISNSSFVVLETNLEIDSLSYVAELCRNEGIPCLIEPVSAEKSKKILHIPGQLDLITPNLSELETLSMERRHLASNGALLDLLEILCAPLGKRVQNILVTLGEQGVFYYQAANTGKWYKPLPTKVVDANGAGDAFVAGLVCGIFHNHGIDFCIDLGMAAAHLTLQSQDTVNQEISFEKCMSIISP